MDRTAAQELKPQLRRAERDIRVSLITSRAGSQRIGPLILPVKSDQDVYFSSIARGTGVPTRAQRHSSATRCITIMPFASQRPRALTSGAIMRNVSIFVLTLVSVALNATATAAPPERSGYGTQLVKDDIRQGGNAVTTETPTKPQIVAASKSDACGQIGGSPSVGCAPVTPRRNHRTAKQSDAKSDARRWTSMIGF